MTSNPVTVEPEATISSVALEMNRRKFRHFPVAEITRTGKRLVGIVSKYDIARGFPDTLNPFSLEVMEDTVPRPVCLVMTKRVITVRPGCPIEEAAKILRSHRIGALPVIRDNRLVGIITESDIFDAFISMTAARTGGSRLVIQSDADTSPIPSVIELSRQNKLDVVSILSFHESRARATDLSIFRFARKLPPGFIQQICSLGFRVMVADE